MSGPRAIHATRAGFVLGDRLVHADMENVIHVRQSSGDLDIELPGAFIYCVAYCADSPGKLLISGQRQTESEVFTLEYDLETGEQHLLECDGRPAYKCTILDDQVFCAQCIREHFESRRISESSSMARRSINTAVRRPPGQLVSICPSDKTTRCISALGLWRRWIPHDHRARLPDHPNRRPTKLDLDGCPRRKADARREGGIECRFPSLENRRS